MSRQLENFLEAYRDALAGRQTSAVDKILRSPIEGLGEAVTNGYRQMVNGPASGVSDVLRDVTAMKRAYDEWDAYRKAGRKGTAVRAISKEEEARRKAADEAEYQKEKDYKSKKGHKIEASAENPDDFIEFTYVPGDTFGQKILDLGIGTDNGLWGENGDVAFYTQQLIDGGYLDDNGNVKLGVPIRLKKRKQLLY